MREQNKKLEVLGAIPVAKALFIMGVPTMIGMMINALYNLADAYFVGSLGESALGAISIAYPIGQVVVGLGLLFGSGAGSYLSRLLGKGERETADKVASTALYSSILVGGILIIGTLLFLHPVVKLLGATESILPYAVPYTRIYVISSIFNVFNVTMNSIVTSEGAAKTTMCALLTGAILNIGLDPVFIYMFHWGVAGAAIATAVSQMATTAIYVCYILRRKSLFHFRIKDCCVSKAIWLEISKIGIPTFLFQVLTSVSIALINIQAKPYGDSIVAAMGAVTRILSMGSLMVFGFIKGFQPIAGYSYGAKKYDRLRQATRTSLLWSTIFCTAFGLLLAFFSNAIISQFTTGDTTLIEAGTEALRANGISFLLFGFYTVYSSLFLALGKAKEGLFLGACRQGVCFIPLILLFPQIAGLRGIFYAQPVADGLSALVTGYMAWKLHKKHAFDR